jgi:hypothetical protein
LPSAALAVLSVLAGCDGAPPETTPDGDPELSIALDRREADGPDIVVVKASLRRGEEPAAGETVTVTAEGGTAGQATDLGGGDYEVEVVPAAESGELRIQVGALGLSAERTAVVLAAVEAGWGQPERVPGLVNTKGYEDSAEISPDGEWLIVSNYSPIDFICCFLGCQGDPAQDPAAPACNTSIGPYSAPERPDLPGAARIVSSTQIHDEAPSIGLDLPDGEDFQVALPPVAAYGFHRQADGSFAEPFAIAFEADGIPVAPFGFEFVGPPQGSTATVLYGWTDLQKLNTPEDTGNDLWRDTLTLGEWNNLGTFSFEGGKPVVDATLELVALPDPTGPQGNPAVSDDGVWFDTEGGVFDLFFAAGDPLGGPLAAPVTVALSTAGRSEFQPFLHGGRLYFAADFETIVSSERAPGGDPASAATWSPERVELRCEPGATATGAIVSIGEPSLSERGGVVTLYFIYAVKTASGFDMSVGRVDRRQ